MVAEPPAESASPAGDRPPRDPSGVEQAYFSVVAAIGFVLVLVGVIMVLFALRTLLFPASESADPSEFFGGPPEDSNATVRSLIGALGVAIPGALVFAWHRRESKRRERDDGRPVEPWGRAVYLYTVCFLTLLIALGAAVAALFALRDSAVPVCYEIPGFEDPVTGDAGVSFDSEGSPIPPIEIGDLDPGVFTSEEECYPATGEALRSALDAGIVAAVAGGAWLWHLRRTRRRPAEEPVTT